MQAFKAANRKFCYGKEKSFQKFTMILTPWMERSLFALSVVTVITVNSVVTVNSELRNIDGEGYSKVF